MAAIMIIRVMEMSGVTDGHVDNQRVVVKSSNI